MRAISTEAIAYFSQEELFGQYELGDGVGRILGSDSADLISLDKGSTLGAQDLSDLLVKAMADTRRKNVGYELVLAMPKQLSLAWALGGEEFGREILHLHDFAVEATLNYIEATEISPSGRLEGLGSQGGCAISFNHALSRSHDPHIHSHLIIVNSVRARGQDCTSALDARRLFWNEGFFRSVYRHYLSSRILEFEKDCKGDYLDRCGYGPHLDYLTDFFSSRSREIYQKASEYGGSQDARRLAGLINRPQKVIIDLQGRKVAWREKAQEAIESKPKNTPFKGGPTKRNARVWGALHSEVNFQLQKDYGIGADEALKRAAVILGFDETDPNLYGRMARSADRISPLEYADRILKQKPGSHAEVLLLDRPENLRGMHRMAAEVRAIAQTAGELQIYDPSGQFGAVWKSALSASTFAKGADGDGGSKQTTPLAEWQADKKSDPYRPARLLLVSPNRMAVSEICELLEDRHFGAVIGLRSYDPNVSARNDPVAGIDMTPLCSTNVGGSGSIVIMRDNQTAFGFALDQTLKVVLETSLSEGTNTEEVPERTKIPLAVSTKYEARVAAELLERSFSESEGRVESLPWRRVIVPPSFCSAGKPTIGELSRKDPLELKVGGVRSTISKAKEKYFRPAHALSFAECEALDWPSFKVALQTDRQVAPSVDGKLIAEVTVMSLLAIDFSMESRIEFMRAGWRPADDRDIFDFVAGLTQQNDHVVESVGESYAELVSVARNCNSGMSTVDDLTRAMSDFEIKMALSTAAIKSAGVEGTHFEHKLGVQRRVLGLDFGRESDGFCLAPGRHAVFERGIELGI